VKSGNGQRAARDSAIIGPVDPFPETPEMSLIHEARGVAVTLGALLMSGFAHASPDQDRATVAALDTEYQAAVERNDAEGMARILHPEMILVVGRGLVFTCEDLLRSAREQEFVYEHQVEEEGTQTVRLYGDDTAIVTALLWLKGTGPQGPFDRRLWFSDTYVRTPEGWRYAFGQASLNLPPPQ
jgi:ketosteroid isomerase-like protein